MSRSLAISRVAIVAGLTNYKEADRIVRLLTPDMGRITALARSARSSSKRFGGSLDIGNRLEVSIRPPRSPDGWWSIDGATLLDGRHHTRTCIERITLVAYCTEVCARLAREDHPEPKLFGLLEMALSLLDAMISPPMGAFRLGLEAKALTFAGLCPSLTNCVRCDTPLCAPITFAHDGASHQECGHTGTPVSLEWIGAIEAARRSPLRDSIDLNLPAGPLWAMAEAIELHLGSRLRSRPILATLCG